MLNRAEQKDWKRKYRELVAELETKEHAWEKLETALRRAASQLAIAAMGQSDELDVQVGDVVDMLRPGTGAAELGHSLQRLSSTIARVELENTGLQKALPEPVEELNTRMTELVSVLVDRLMAVPELSDFGAELAMRLKTPGRQRDWDELFKHLADGVAEAVATLQAQRSELEHFLEQVQQQLTEFEEFAQWQHDEAQHREQSSVDLEATVQQEMTGLRAEAANAPSLTELKLKVQLHLDSVGDRLQSYRDEEQQRFAEAQAQNAKLAGEVEKLRGKTHELAQVVGEQRQHLMLDALTQVHSRYAYEQRIVEEWRRAQRYNQPLAYALWDIDRFKAVNDEFGHAAGDRLLQTIGLIFMESKRSEDFVARMGGEEFVLLLPMADAATAFQIAERLRERIAQQRFHHSGRPAQITISCGVTEFRDNDTPVAVYERADRALYEAKEAGRNRCVLS